jgi:prepilin-type N-terminal cleavage/methylation domain-containing protein
MPRPDALPAPDSRRSGAAGFTLVEVIVVIAILAILAASLAPLVAAQIDQARRDATENHLEALSDALRAYQRDTNAFPPDTGDDVADLGELETDTLGATGWSGPYIASAWSAGDDIPLTVAQDYAGAEHRAEVTYERLKLVAGDVYGNNPTQAPSTYTIPVAWQTDAWGNNLVYVYNNDQSAVVYSPGPDGTPGAGGPSGDDIYFAMVWSPPGGGGGGGSGGDSDDVLAVVPGQVYQCGGNDEVGFEITNNDSVDIEVTQIQITWDYTWRRLQQVQSGGTAWSCNGGTDVWSSWSCGIPGGQQNSPTTLTSLCKTVQIPAGSTYTFDEFDFDGAISGMTVTAVFTHQQVGGGPVHTSTITLNVP